MGGETLITEGQGTDTASQQHVDEPAAGTRPSESEATRQTDPGQETDGGDKGEKKDDSGDKQEEESKTPDEYEFEVPDDTQLDDVVIDAFSEVAKELDMPQEAAQKMIDKVAPVMQARQAEQITAVWNEWAESSKSDKEFGGDKLEENLATAKKAMDTFGTPELTELLNTSGLGNHPEIIRMFYRAGKAISEDTFVGGKQAVSSAGGETTAQRMYPNMNP